MGRHGWALGDATSHTRKGAWIPTAGAWFTPAPGSPRHQSLPSVTHAGQDRSFHPLPRVGMHWGPVLPRFQICLGWIQPAIGLWQALISAPAVNFPPQRSRATGSAGPGLLPSPDPRRPGSPNSTERRELRDGGMFSRRNSRPPFIPPRGPQACGGWMLAELTAVPGCQRVWGRKGLTRGSLLTLGDDLNQTERFCHPSR